MTQRRKFIQQLTLGLASVFSFAAFSQKNKTTMSNNNLIRRIKPLGFQWETADPFLFCVHHEDYFPKGNAALGPVSGLEGRQLGQDFIVKDGYRMYHGTTVPGFPGHPHRGFETITVVRKGLVDHADSMGAAGRYGNGDVQWMTAGKGVQHAEMFPLLKQDEENPLELFQIWLNLPAKNKFVEPHFKMLWSETVPKITTAAYELEVLVGTFDNRHAQSGPPNSWASDPKNEVAIWNINLQSNSEITLPPASTGINRTLYIYEGNGLQLGDKEIPYYHAVEVKEDELLHLKSGAESIKILVLQGRPIGEPVVQHGPFVMNTREEIYAAFNEYQQTQFGGWPWPRYDQVHDPKLGRFAKHADGTLETKG
jgi:quercetin 2,3-dioxygenase